MNRIDSNLHQFQHMPRDFQSKDLEVLQPVSRLAGRCWDHCKSWVSQIIMYDKGLQNEMVNTKLESMSQCGLKWQMQHCMFL